MTYEELKKAYEEMSEKCASLEKEIEEKERELENKNEELKNKNIELEDKNIEIENLTEQLLKRNKMLFGKKSEQSKYLGFDGQLTFDGDIINEAEDLCDLSAAEPDETSLMQETVIRKKKPHRGRNQLRKDLPQKEIEFELPENERICSECGDELVPFTREYITSRLCVIPEKVYMVRYYRKVYKCRNCDKNGIKSNIVKAPDQSPAPVIPKGLPDSTLVADIMQRKYQLGIPLYRQEQYWKFQGIYLSRTSMANWLIKASEWFKPVLDRFWKLAFKEPVLNADETGCKVLKKDGKPSEKRGDMWVCATAASASRKISLYVYRADKSKATAEELFAEYDGVLQTDGMQSYGSGSYTNAGCWAHARRRFFDSIPKGNKKCKAAHAMSLIDKAFKLEAKAREDNFTEKQILEMRQKQIKPIIEEFYDFIGTLTTGKGSHLYSAVNYAQNQKEQLLVFLDDPKVEMSNNLAERTVKPFVINRKNFLFSDTEKGADASAAIMSIIETAKRNELDIYAYLLYLLNKLPEWGGSPTEEQLDSIMPWSKDLPAYCKTQYSELL